jgi:hypothetical protein
MKKTRVLCFLFLAFSSGLLAQKSPVQVEQVGFYFFGNPPLYGYTVSIPDPYSQTTFASPALFTIKVPPSKGSTLYFESSSQVLYQLANAPWDGVANAVFRVVSSVIPENIGVTYGLISLLELHMTNNAGDQSTGVLRAFRTVKWEMREQAVDFWNIYYSDGSQVPEDIALSLIRQLIAKGFTLEVSIEGNLMGFTRATVRPLSVEITRTVVK